MAINKKLIHFKNKLTFELEVANENILDTSIVFIQDSKEISTHGTIYKTVNWSVLESKPSIKNYMRFVAIEDSVINLTSINVFTGEADNSVDLKHSKDGVTWTQYDFNPIPLAAGETLYMKGNNENGFSYENMETGEARLCVFGDVSQLGIQTTPSTGNFECHGNIMSLLYGDDFENKTTIPNAGCFTYMFRDCTGLTTAPELPATTLADNCYQYMFNGCTSLNHITMLATDISANGCLSYWVKNVSTTGTFVKHPDMTSLSTGTSGIPNGWTVEDAVIS